MGGWVGQSFTQYIVLRTSRLSSFFLVHLLHSPSSSSSWLHFRLALGQEGEGRKSDEEEQGNEEARATTPQGGVGAWGHRAGGGGHGGACGSRWVGGWVGAWSKAEFERSSNVGTNGRASCCLLCERGGGDRGSLGERKWCLSLSSSSWVASCTGRPCRRAFVRSLHFLAGAVGLAGWYVAHFPSFHTCSNTTRAENSTASRAGAGRAVCHVLFGAINASCLFVLPRTPTHTLFHTCTEHIGDAFNELAAPRGAGRGGEATGCGTCD